MSAISEQEVHDVLVKERVIEHYNEALQYFDEKQIVGIFLQGSQNYGLDLPTSDVDTKLIVAPTFEDIVFMRDPVSTTHIRANDEHTDFKDVRAYLDLFRKQNLNFLEILFTKYFIINPLYKEEWMRLVEAREFIARMNPYRAVKSMKGIAMDKYHAMEHPYPSKVDIINKMGYDPKQVHHLVRVDNYLTRYIAGDSYEACLTPEPKMHDFLMSLKRGEYTLSEARDVANLSMDHVNKIADQFCAENPEHEQSWCKALLDDVSCNIMKIAIKEELNV